MLTQEGITYRTDLFYSITGLASLDREPFSDPDERIYIIASYEPYARELLCEAYHRNIRYPTHLLLTYQWYSPNWWLVEDQNYTCTGEQRGEVLHMTLSLDIFVLSRLDKSFSNTSMNITEEEFLRESKHHANKPPFNFRISPGRFYYCHDATWALAWSLNKAITLSGLGGELTNFTYMDNEVSQTIIRHMNFSFTGITGRISFDSNGIRKAIRLLVYQHRLDVKGNVNTREIGRIVLEDDQHRLQYLPNESILTIWPNGLIPYDGVPNVEIDTVATAQAVLGILLGIAGITFTIVCLLFNFYFRNKRIIQISRPMLNYLIILGAIIYYMAAILFVIPTTDKSASLALITARLWCISLGYSFCYGTIIMKMCRVYYIVHNPRPNKNIQDWVLALGVLVLVIIDLVLLILNIIIDKAMGQYEATLVPNRDRIRTVSGENRVSTEHVIYIYDTLTYKVFLGLLFSYKLVFQLTAMVLALCTHDIKVKGLDDAKYIIAAVYIQTINLLLAAMIIYALTENLYAYTVICFTFIATTLILGVAFIPKMIALYKDPQGENVFGKYETPSLKSPPQYIQKQQRTTCSETNTGVAVEPEQRKANGTDNVITAVDEHTSRCEPSMQNGEITE